VWCIWIVVSLCVHTAKQLAASGALRGRNQQHINFSRLDISQCVWNVPKQDCEHIIANLARPTVSYEETEIEQHVVAMLSIVTDLAK
jgi:hypothetical protein